MFGANNRDWLGVTPTLFTWTVWLWAALTPFWPWSISGRYTGSPAVQVGILTERIKEVTDHLKTNKKDHMARRGLLQMVGQRRRLLRYIAEKDSQAYLDLIDKLGIRK